jgi:hypothetical protein
MELIIDLAQGSLEEEYISSKLLVLVSNFILPPGH